jgi:hypothetical protein
MIVEYQPPEIKPHERKRIFCTAIDRVARRARLREILSPANETAAILHILNRPRAAHRIAQERRQAHRAKEAAWIDIERALEIEGTSDSTRLRMELKQGLPCRFQHRGRWWQWKPVEEVAPLLTGRNPLDLENERWKLVIHEKFWRERLGKPAALPPPTQSHLRNAADDDIRVAMRAVYDEKGDERPDTNKIISPVRSRLEAAGLYAKWQAIKQIAGEREFKDRRNKPGPQKSRLRPKPNNS